MNFLVGLGSALGGFASGYSDGQQQANRNKLLKLQQDEAKQKLQLQQRGDQAAGLEFQTLLGGQGGIDPSAGVQGVPGLGGAPFPTTPMPGQGSVRGQQSGGGQMLDFGIDQDSAPTRELAMLPGGNVPYNDNTGAATRMPPMRPQQPMDIFSSPDQAVGSQDSAPPSPRSPDPVRASLAMAGAQPGNVPVSVAQMTGGFPTPNAQPSISAPPGTPGTPAPPQWPGVTWKPETGTAASPQMAGGGQQQQAAAIPPPVQHAAKMTAVAAANQYPTQIYGGSSLQQMAQAIDKANPGAPPAVKMLALSNLQKLMAPEERQQFQMMMQQSRDDIRLALKDVQIAGQQGTIFQQPDGSFVRVTPQGVVPIPGLQPGAHKPGGTTGQMTPEPQVPDKWEGMPDKAPPGIRQDVWDASIRYVKTGTMPPLGNRSEMRQQILAAEPAARQALGVSTTDAPENALRFKRLQTVESAFGKGQQANNMISLNTVADHLALMREYAEALNSGDIPLANKVLNRINKEAGYSNVTNFDTARDIMADEVVRLLTSTGGTEADRAGMQQRFSSAGSPAQIVGALDVAQNFVIGRFNALQQQYAGNDKKRQDFFQNDMMTPQAKRMFAQHGQQTGGQMPTATGPDGKKVQWNGTAWVPVEGQ